MCRTGRCTWPRRHYGFSGFIVSPAAAAGERCRSAGPRTRWIRWSISRFVESRSGASAMICHVCGGDAVGQCKGCAKFYCAAHGDLYCIHCTSRVQSSGERPRPQVNVGPDPTAPERTMPLSTSGPQCYECRNPADRACAKCGRFFCDQHGGMGISRSSSPWWSADTPMCNQCTSYEGKWLACILVWVVVGTIGILSLISMTVHR